MEKVDDSNCVKQVNRVGERVKFHTLKDHQAEGLVPCVFVQISGKCRGNSCPVWRRASENPEVSNGEGLRRGIVGRLLSSCLGPHGRRIFIHSLGSRGLIEDQEGDFGLELE